MAGTTAAPAVNLPALYSDLNKLGQNGDFARAIKVARKILQEAPNEEAAFHCLIVSLIQESEFQDALKAFSKNDSFAEKLSFERAYCLYRQNQTLEALNILNAVANPETKHKELKAQVLYRLERYSECMETYRDLMKNTQDDYEAERETNLAAVTASLSLEGKSADLPMFTEDSYELCYNSACRLLGEGKASEAEAKLRKAETLCRKSLEEDGATEEEIEDELSLIRVQLGYALQIQGRTAEAQQLYNKVLKQKPTDIGLVAVAANNSACINGAQNVFDSKRKLKMAVPALETTEAKLTSKQRKVLSVNQCLFLILSAQTELAKKALEQLKKDYPSVTVDMALIQVALDLKGNRTDNALAELAELGKNSDVNLVLASGLARVQLLLQQGQIDPAIGVLNELLQRQFRLGILGSLVTLHVSKGERERAVALINQALEKVEKLRSSGKNQQHLNDVKLLWRQAAAFHLKGGDPEKAAHCLEQLRKLEPSDTTTLARLVLAYSQFDPAQAQKAEKDLPPWDFGSGGSSVDPEALETTTWALGLKHARKTPGGPLSPASGGKKVVVDKTAKKKTKKKKKILPKNYDPNVTPDPERWLPRRERSTYRPKKKDRRYRDARADVGKGTQGSSAALLDVENKFDMSKVKASPKPETASSPAAAPQPGSGGSQQQKKVATQQKKKKRGRF